MLPYSLPPPPQGDICLDVHPLAQLRTQHGPGQDELDIMGGCGVGEVWSYPVYHLYSVYLQRGILQ